MTRKEKGTSEAVWPETPPKLPNKVLVRNLHSQRPLRKQNISGTLKKTPQLSDSASYLVYPAVWRNPTSTISTKRPPFWIWHLHCPKPRALSRCQGAVAGNMFRSSGNARDSTSNKGNELCPPTTCQFTNFPKISYESPDPPNCFRDVS